MSSKNHLAEERPEPPPASSVSLTRRLTLLCAASSFLMLVLATGCLYWVVDRNLEREDDAVLADKVQRLRNLLRDRPPESEFLKAEIQSASPVPRPLRFYIRIVKVSGETILETPGMTNPLGVAAFPRPAAADEALRPGPELRLRGGKCFRLVSAWATVGAARSEPCLLQIALDASNDEALLADLRRTLRLIVFFGVVFSGVAGVMIARKTLRPLEELTRATERITSSQLRERVIPSGWPKELASLAKGFDRMLDRLEEAFNRLSQFSGDLAHELRTPINNLRGEAGVALSQARTPEEYRHVLESSLEEYARLSRLIDNLLFLARADSSMTTINRSACDARKAIEVVREYYQALAQDGGVEIVCEGEASVDADPLLLRQAVNNLLANALRQTPRGGQVRIAVRPREDRATELTVADAGCGIGAEHLPKIFDRFYRVDSARAQSSAGGFGLGLAIVKSIMTLHGGSVRVESKVGRGSTFTLEFPPTTRARR